MNKNTQNTQEGRQTAPSVTLEDIAEIKIPCKHEISVEEIITFSETIDTDTYHTILEIYRLGFMRGRQAGSRPVRKARKDYPGGLVQIDCPKEYRMTTDEASRIYNEGGGIYWKFQKVFNLAFDRGHTVGFERGYRAANL